MRRLRHVLLFAVVVICASGCDSASPLAPTGTPGSTVIAGPAAPTDPNAITIAGHVYDAAWRSLGGARIEVVDGPQAGLSTVSTGNGEFRLSGAFNETTRFRATAPGYRETTKLLPERCAACNPNWWVYFSLETIAPPPALDGDYTLTFVANSSCGSLPEEFRSRTYSVTVRPANSSTAGQFTVSLKGGEFVTRYDGFDVGIAGDHFAASLGDSHGSPGVAERVAPDTYLTFGGLGEARLASDDMSTIAGSFDGVISYCQVRGEAGFGYSCSSGAVSHLSCQSTQHSFVLKRGGSNMNR